MSKGRFCGQELCPVTLSSLISKIAGEPYSGNVTHIVAVESNKIVYKQHKEVEKRLTVTIWVTNLNRCHDMLQKVY